MSAITSGAAVQASGPFAVPRRSIPRTALFSNAAFSIAIYAVFFLLIGLPLLVVLLQAVLPDLFNPVARSWAPSLAPLARAFGSARVLESILHSVILGCVVAVTATALGAGYAVIMNRTDVPFRRFLSVVPWAVFLTPSYLKALAWVLLMSPGGYLPQLGILSPDVARSFFGLGGLVFVHTLNLFPLAYFVMAGALWGLGSEFEDAARIFGAKPLKVWLRINGPLLAPAIALCCLALFAEVLSDFGLASTIARFSGFGLLTYGIYVAASDYPVDFALAAT
jgi:iron(III) transport system permease protein